jgi:hypothetical protein
MSPEEAYNSIATKLNSFRQQQICVYGADENERCDCKYGINVNSRALGEQTGCPEMRDIVEAYRAFAKFYSKKEE